MTRKSRTGRAVPSPTTTRAQISACAALIAALAAPAAAHAHGLDGLAARETSTLGFVPLGIEHMALGWDHLLFIIGIVVIAAEPRRAVKLISTFAAGHSTTLILATLAGWQLNATLVDVFIALSLVYVGVRGIYGRPENWNPVFGAVFGFGLIHGLGLSTRLQDAGLPDDGILPKTIAFNVGIEIGQLAVIALVVAVGWVALRLVHARPPHSLQIAGTLLAAVGMMAAVVLAIPASDGSSADAEPVIVARKASACTQEPIDPPTFAGGNHPDQKFQEPGADVDGVDIVHVLTDGYVAIRYKPTLPAADIQALRELVSGDQPPHRRRPAGQTASRGPRRHRAPRAHLQHCRHRRHQRVHEHVARRREGRTDRITSIRTPLSPEGRVRPGPTQCPAPGWPRFRVAGRRASTEASSSCLSTTAWSCDAEPSPAPGWRSDLIARCASAPVGHGAARSRAACSCGPVFRAPVSRKRSARVVCGERARLWSSEL
ncbi:hypothetical protein DSM112329_00777 [Paraconexibacter sp. AEG42_29]|uniref:HupE/UreJ family protein n=1 Tax=Paraconexibacter sp. AEG42_29 TaxID=2997339 RepID=A0AAU7AR28_9ACTN